MKDISFDFARSAAQLKELERHECCEGEVRFLTFPSQALGLPTKLGLFLPRAALEGKKVPVVYALAGLTCTQETFLIKANAVRYAAEHGLALVTPDTSPRGAQVAAEDEAYDLGTGAGFYVDATAQPWAAHYRMWSYVGQELPGVLEAAFPLDGDRCGIMGHSMGGMGALAFGLRNPRKWKTVSAFAPICAPARVPWGQKVTETYFGGDEAQWRHYDPCLLLTEGYRTAGKILVDQGLKDEFLPILCPDLLEQAAREAGQPLELRRHKLYDHSYWFVQSFIASQILHHARGLTPQPGG
ncbi:S-formylglutathione hydrolase [Oecophyllibacter saccharovorans]|uniref:S-formylglutathione hydrolase n=1 Tax=Oecophyllibacter saccharovorans TaxID=2558360 RepID=UPI00387E551E